MDGARILARRVDHYVANGYQIETSTDHVVTLARGKRVNHTLHVILSVVTLGGWLTIWALLSRFGGRRIATIRLLPNGKLDETEGRELSGRASFFLGLFLVLDFLAIGLVALLIVVAVGAAASEVSRSETLPRATGGTRSAPATPTTVPLPSVGQSARKGNWQITLHQQDKRAEIPTPFGAAEVAQGEFRILTLTLANVGQRSYPLNAHDFSIRTPSGVEYAPASEASTALLGDTSGPEVLWLGATVQPGLSTDVRVIFDVPPDATGLVLDIQGVRFALPD